MKILLVGDPHYSSEQVLVRKDNYPETMLNKTEQTLELAKKLGADLYLVAGDFCHIKKFSLGYLNSLITLFRSYSIPKASVIGNHDIWYGKPETVCRSPLGTMFSSGVFLPKPGEWTVETDDCFILFLPYMLHELPPLHAFSSSKKLILATHYFYNRPDMPDNILEEYTQKFDYILLGHDHEGYPVQKVNKATIVRPGGLSRGTRHKSSITRPVQVAFIDTEKGTVEYIPLVYKPAEEIFNMSRLEREKKTRDSNIVRELTSSVSVSDGSDVLGILSKFDIPQDVKENTIGWLREGNIIQ